jgi:hypothetical protein
MPRAMSSLPKSPARLSARRSPAPPDCALRGPGRAGCARGRGQARRRDVTVSPTRTGPGEGGAGDHQADARQGEAAVDGQAEAACGPCARARWPPLRHQEGGAYSAATPSPVAWPRPGTAARPPVRCRPAARRFPRAPRQPLAARRHRPWSAPPRRVPGRAGRQMARCSRVCGIGPSSAATTSSTKSMPVAPASMLCTSRSWPGTSTKPSAVRRRRRHSRGRA